jgi:hypothetical protein
MPATIDDSAVLTEIAAALERRSSRAESNLEELRNEVRNRAFSIWERTYPRERKLLWECMVRLVRSPG